jgi:hypothetical protein
MNNIKKHDINHPLWDVMNNLQIMRSYLKDDDNILKNLIVEPYFDLLDETIEKVEALYQKDIE